VLWSLLLRECNDECLRGLLPHMAVVAAFSVELAAVGENRLCSFLGHLNKVHKHVASAQEAFAEVRRMESMQKAALDSAGARVAAADATAYRATTALHMMRDELEPQLEKSHFKLQTLTAALEQANRRLVDASAHWEHQLFGERERGLAQSIGLKDQCLALQRAWEQERAERTVEFKKTRDIAARLDATTEEFHRKGHEMAAVDHRALQVQQSAEQTLAQMEDWMRRTLGSWQKNKDQEVLDLKRRLELVQLGGVGGVSSEEADRSLLLVASLWHAAGRKEPHDLTHEEDEQCKDGALNSWRVYFHREVGSEPPLLRPTSNIILTPLRAVAGMRVAEVVAGGLLPLDPSTISPLPPGGGALVRSSSTFNGGVRADGSFGGGAPASSSCGGAGGSVRAKALGPL